MLFNKEIIWFDFENKNSVSDYLKYSYIGKILMLRVKYK